ncbi:MAG: hypothetical protein J6C05_09265 [Prevotella sp.]|nr:hypothetical protein [Prevotella sp.]
MCHSNGCKFSDYIKVGLPLQVIIGVAMTFLLIVPKQLSHTAGGTP